MEVFGRKAFVGIAFFLSCACGAYPAEVRPTEEPAEQPPALLSADELNADLDFLVKTIEEVHPNMYAYTVKEKFAEDLQGVKNRLDRPMSRTEFYKLVAPLVASLKSGHTNVRPPMEPFSKYLSDGGKVFPIALQWDGTTARIKRSYADPALPVGATILKIDGEEAAAVFHRLGRYWPAECRESNPPVVLEFGGGFFLFYYLWLEYGSDEPMVVTLMDSQGEAKDYEVKPVSFTEIASQVEQAGAAGGRQAVGSYRYLAENAAGIMTLNGFSDAPGESFADFIKATFKTLKAQKVSTLVIDIRENQGGDSSLGDLLLRYLTDKPFRQFEKGIVKTSKPVLDANRGRIAIDSGGAEPPSLPVVSTWEGDFLKPGKNPLRFSGRLFLLIGPMTASSATSFASAVKHFRIGTLVGEETWDTTVSYGDCLVVELPNSKLSAQVAYKQFFQVGGQVGRGVIPDYEVKQGPEDSAGGVDTVLEFTLDLARQGNRPAQDAASSQGQ